MMKGSTGGRYTPTRSTGGSEVNAINMGLNALAGEVFANQYPSQYAGYYGAGSSDPMAMLFAPTGPAPTYSAQYNASGRTNPISGGSMMGYQNYSPMQPYGFNYSAPAPLQIPRMPEYVNYQHMPTYSAQPVAPSSAITQFLNSGYASGGTVDDREPVSVDDDIKAAIRLARMIGRLTKKL